MQFEALPFAAFTEYLIDCRATEQRRLKTHIWVCEAGGCSILRQSKMDKPLFRQGYVKVLRCIYMLFSNGVVNAAPPFPNLHQPILRKPPISALSHLFSYGWGMTAANRSTNRSMSPPFSR
ncbi:hypothetical protein FP515_16525 [Geobacillus thermoleovorans]|uniref:Uncharacterized protein n=1 Tax=Geobacillus thermoleovorans TaxID=33941 RepID=A0A2Z3N8F8_GEOTH|nr:hypothetical protein C1N76_09835 [Geobacillus thermoleovorans]NNU99340.1 hypothetical protein [Geobacillus sp. DSP4a]QCK81021.1 hypothetical protein E5Z46_00695 [Geobacillus kaustophilus NBRC 102445]QDY74603.1 hypothetical protein FP515_16525 [Geobacillus thermoleovorans]TLS33036.1 hypothetical protein FDK15_09880 [Geobacillus thermoleovorans]